MLRPQSSVRRLTVQWASRSMGREVRIAEVYVSVDAVAGAKQSRGLAKLVLSKADDDVGLSGSCGLLRRTLLLRVTSSVKLAERLAGGRAG